MFKYKFFISLVFLCFFLLPMWSCVSYVKDAMTFSENINGFVSKNTYQYWYKTKWAKNDFYIDGIQKKKNNAKEIRFIDLIDGAHKSINNEIIKFNFNKHLSIFHCKNENVDIISQLQLNNISYRIVKEEYFFNGNIKFLLHFTSKSLMQNFNDSVCH